jgi:hypothetical protein
MINTLLMTTWLCLPIAPLNPVDEDTLAATSFHFMGGVSSPNGIVSMGPVMSIKYEMLIVHPFVTRTTLDFAYNKVESTLFPRGDLYTMSYGVDAVYYRGTNHLTAYLGFGLLYAFHQFDPSASVADSLYAAEGVTEVALKQKLGFRLILGLRYHRSYSMEISVVEMRPDFKKTGSQGVGRESRQYQPTRTGSFRLSFGYVIEI